MSGIALVATLIVNPARVQLTSALIDKAVRSVKATHFSVLADNIAVDIFLDEQQAQQQAHDALKLALDNEPVDIIIQPIEGRRKRLLLADMDSTIIGQECIDELANQLGLGVEIAAMTERAMRGLIDFNEALRQRVALLKDLPLATIDKIIKENITLNEGAIELVATMRKNGGYTALISGGFSLFARAIAQRAGFDESHANILCHDGKKLTGQVAQPILDAHAKAQKLRQFCQKMGLETTEVMAVGDGANDIEMLRLAGSGVAYHAKPQVRKAAAMHIENGDLTALLYIQGYKKQDFVS